MVTEKDVLWVARTVPALFLTVTVTPYVPEQAAGGISKDRAPLRVSFALRLNASAPAWEGKRLVTQVPGLDTVRLTVTAGLVTVALVTPVWMNVVPPAATMAGLTAAVTTVPAKAFEASSAKARVTNGSDFAILFFSNVDP